MKIVYMGTPDFAVAPLKALIENGYDVVGAFTQPDKPVGRKAVLTPPPVKVTALENNIPVFQPDTLKNGEGVKLLEDLKPDLCVVVAYGKILPEDFLAFPKYGCINIHGSILPEYRGAAPIQRSVLDGCEFAGVTAMQMDKGLDTGDMLLVEKTRILSDETSGDLYERLTVIGAEVLIKTLHLVENGELQPVKQDDSQSTYAAMLDKSMSPVDWTKSAQEIHNQIRGLDPWPVAQTVLNGKNLKLFRSSLVSDIGDGKPGEALPLKNGLAVFCGDGNAVLINEVQYEGKKRMKSADFLRGCPIEKGTILG
ncbi:MAG: methionyl-tRNA formyltransferase [Clostridia bacterium]|nr:methionyl-tRNA formyltransferase [Clostridia bacterium]